MPVTRFFTPGTKEDPLLFLLTEAQTEEDRFVFGTLAGGFEDQLQQER